MITLVHGKMLCVVLSRIPRHVLTISCYLVVSPNYNMHFVFHNEIMPFSQRNRTCKGHFDIQRSVQIKCILFCNNNFYMMGNSFYSTVYSLSQKRCIITLEFKEIETVQVG